MKKITFVLAALILAVSANAQTSDAYNYSLQQCIKYTLEHQPKILNARLDEGIANGKKNELLGIGYPQINASLGVNHFIEKPTTLVPVSNFGGPEGIYTPFQFNLTDNGEAALNLSQLIFDGSFIIGVRAAKTFEVLARKQTKQTEQDVVVTISKAYYGVLVGTARMELLDASITRLDKTYNDTKAMFDQGFVEKIDVDRLEIALNNLKTERDKVERLTELAIYLLKFQMGMDQNANLTLVDNLKDIKPPEAALLPDSVDYTKRVEYDVIQTQKYLQGMNIKRYKAGYLPNLVAFGSLGSTVNSEQFDIFSPEKKWYWNSAIGAKISLNIFDGNIRHSHIQQETLTLKKIDNGIYAMQQGFMLEYGTAKRNYTNAMATLEIQKKNRELSAEVVSVTKTKYEQGVGTNIELVDAESKLRESESNFFNAMYDAILSKIDLDKAMGTLKY